MCLEIPTRGTFWKQRTFWLVETCKKKTKAKKPPPAWRTIMELKVPCAHMENFSQVVMKVSFKCDY